MPRSYQRQRASLFVAPSPIAITVLVIVVATGALGWVLLSPPNPSCDEIHGTFQWVQPGLYRELVETEEYSPGHGATGMDLPAGLGFPEGVALRGFQWDPDPLSNVDEGYYHAIRLGFSTEDELTWHLPPSQDPEHGRGLLFSQLARQLEFPPDMVDEWRSDAQGEYELPEHRGTIGVNGTRPFVLDWLAHVELPLPTGAGDYHGDRWYLLSRPGGVIRLDFDAPNVYIPVEPGVSYFYVSAFDDVTFIETGPADEIDEWPRRAAAHLDHLGYEVSVNAYPVEHTPYCWARAAPVFPPTAANPS